MTDPTEREFEEQQVERQFRASEALAQYHAIEQQVPLGGLPPREYGRIRAECVDAALTPSQRLSLAWAGLEYAMAVARSDINPVTEDPYSPKEVTALFEGVRTEFRTISTDERASRLLCAQARVAQVSVAQHQEIITGKPLLASCKPYVPYLKIMRAVASELIDQPDLTDAERIFIHTLTTQCLLTERVYHRGWFLLAAPRQDWDMSAHSAFRNQHDVHLRFGDSQDDTVVSLSPLSLQTQINKPSDEFAAMRTYLALEPDYALLGKPSFQAGTGQAERYMARLNLTKQLNATVDLLTTHINRSIDRQVALGILVPDEVIKETSKEAPVERDISDAAMWYLLDFDGETLNDQLVAALTELQRIRSHERMLPDERHGLAWMQLEYAKLLALDAGNDRSARDQARHHFGVAIDYFEGTGKMFSNLHRPGDRLDALLSAHAAAVQRGLYTSSDLYALRRILADYHANAAGLFVNVKDVKSDQLAAFRNTLNRATLALVQAAADPEIRHLLLPAPPRLGDRQIAVAFPVLYSERASGYDLASPIAIQVVDGADIVAGPGRVEVGRDALVLDGDPLALLRQLAAYLSAETKSPKGSKNQKAKGGSRSARVEELSEKLAYAISDADV